MKLYLADLCPVQTKLEDEATEAPLNEGFLPCPSLGNFDLICGVDFIATSYKSSSCPRFPQTFSPLYRLQVLRSTKYHQNGYRFEEARGRSGQIMACCMCHSRSSTLPFVLTLYRLSLACSLHSEECCLVMIRELSVEFLLWSKWCLNESCYLQSLANLYLPSYWRKEFTTGYINSDGNPDVSPSQTSLIVSILSAGTFFGALWAAPTGDFLGRRLGLIAACCVFNLGVILQTASTALPMFIAGRFFAGFGVGMVSALSKSSRLTSLDLSNLSS